MSEVVTYDIKVQPVIQPNTVKLNPVPSFFEGAKFIPYTKQLADNKIEVGFTNDRGLPNPDPVTLEFPPLSDRDRTSYDGVLHDTLKEKDDADVQYLLDKTNVVNHKGTTIHANNTIKRNLVANRNKVEVLGQTIQNCLDHSSADKFSILNGTVDQDGYINLIQTADTARANTKITSGVVKPSTTYTFVVDVKECTLDDSQNRAVIGFGAHSNLSVFASAKEFKPNDLHVGITKFTLVTKDSFDGITILDACGLNSLRDGTGSIKFRYAIIEGDWTNKEVSWVPFGLNYPATTEVVEIGKNWNSTVLEIGALNFTTGEPYGYSGSIRTKDFIEVVPNKKYIISKNGAKKQSNIFYYDKDKKFIKRLGDTSYDNFTTENNVRYVKLAWGTTDTTVADLIQIELGDSATEYEPYTERKVNINKPLASASDTVRDRYYVKDGKKYHVQNVLEILVDGSGNWAEYDYAAGKGFYKTINASPFEEYSMHMCGRDYIPIYGDEPKYAGQKVVYFSAGNVVNFINVGKTKEEFIQDLNANPIKFLVQLKTPITTEIETEDMQSFDGQTNITTTNTVKPTLDIDIPSDLNAVTSNLIAENMALKQENQALSNELENQASSIEAQQANMDYISMMTGVEL